MAQTLYFYDLETSGVNPRDARVMQFAGQRTDLQLKPIGEPHNIIIKLTEEILPEPDAILITGITPQQTRVDGITEAEFLRIFNKEIALPDTIFVGFNSVRFDDEFMRFMLYRNFDDPYAWQWQDGRSRWDLLDVVRLTRALRPEGINWPVDAEGKPTNRLELLTSQNGLDHSNAHDALSDVYATIALARLLRTKQTKLFDYLLSIRTKQAVQKVVCENQPFVYASGKYPGEFEKTTVAFRLGDNPKKQGILVYDLRHDPTPFTHMNTAQIVEAWKWKRDRTDQPLPVKTLQFNRCPAVAPLGVLDEASQSRLKIDMKVILENLKKLRAARGFYDQLLEALEIMNKEQQTSFLSSETAVDAQLYDAFIPDSDKPVMSAIRASDPSELADYVDKLHDTRLKSLLPLYKARNFPKQLTDEEMLAWETFRQQRLTGGGTNSRLARYLKRLAELAESKHVTEAQKFLLEELQLYAESIMPLPE
jgi:exodeoxyribonuclease-1